jgi:hypothetical protein
MPSRPPDFKTSGIRAERIIASGSSSNPQLLLIGSGAAGNDGVTVDTSSLILAGTGSDTWLFISGSVGGSDRVTFGGDVFISGTLSVDSISVATSLKSDLIPDGDRTRNLGSPSNRYANVYTGDLHLRNERGNWTILEEADFLCVINNLTGKRYKMVLQPID